MNVQREINMVAKNWKKISVKVCKYNNMHIKDVSQPHQLILIKVIRLLVEI